MSYILDALRRADAERERDPGRGIHAQPVPLPTENGRRIPLWIFAVGAGLVLLVAGALLLRPAPRVAMDLGMPPPNAPVPKQSSAAPPPKPVAAEVSPPAPPPLAVAEPAPAPAPAPERLPERPVVRAPVVTAPAKAVPPNTPPAAPAPAPAVEAPAAAADRVLAFGELPPEVQRELPKMQISGGVHSDNPAQRMLIVGGQVVTEGHEAAPGVVVEQIRPRSAVLKFRGYRYSVQY
ncbi:hypothetical protein GCM10028796_10850 [Ramlibacter monticola]|uniref:General secretion pathway protein GspB n=1 Tax=Ramlibacter monticola TaxID=1926872 RepID=A0A936YVI0_9BURK|nr:general secretion pathway protein GspB [Ramlibacter monticola]MBL0389938.1 general secretion pathway protein GspB [Ramlibacter monticola]